MPALLAEARSALANSQYYMTWLMRLEGQPRDAVGAGDRSGPANLSAARRAVRSQPATHTAPSKHREDLESAIRLARMDLSELQGLPLPSQ